MSKLSRQDIRNRFSSPAEYREFLKENAGVFGIQGWKGAFFDLRGENSPSVQANLGWWCDHGVGETGDTIDLIAKGQNLNLSNKEDFIKAMRIAEEIFGISTESTYVPQGQKFVPNTYNKEEEYKDPVSQTEIDSWYKNRREDPKLFADLASGLLRNLNKKEKLVAVKELSLGLSIETKEVKDEQGNVLRTYIDKRVLLPEIDENNKVPNYYAYKRGSNVKGLKRTSGKPMLAGINRIKTYNKSIPIIFNEGHSDYAHSTGLELHPVTAGSASMKIDPYLPFFKGRMIHFYLDNDSAGATAIARWMLSIIAFNKDLPENEKILFKFFWWSKATLNRALDQLEETIKKHLEREGKIVDSIERERLIELLDKQGYLPKELWNLECIFNDDRILKKGYDFTDFIEEERGNSIFEEVISRYKNLLVK